MVSPTEARTWLKEREQDSGAPFLELPSHENILAAPRLLVQSTLDLENHSHNGKGYTLQESGGRALLLGPPAAPLDREDLDRLHGFPYSRLPHPAYSSPVPAWEMIRTSITSHRGCAGGCSFCSLALHQGRRVTSRSRASLLSEAACIASGPAPGSSARKKSPPRWAGSISDVGGPSANMWQAACALEKGKSCTRSSCLHPSPCPLFSVEQGEGVRLLREIAALPGVRHVRVASGVRFDLALRDREALRAYTLEFTGGQLKVAPEHSEEAVLALMRKPGMVVFKKFLEIFQEFCRKEGKEQYTVPYLMSAFPGCTDEHMRALSLWLRRKNWRPQQVQCFVPTPGTVATAMFYARTGPDGKPLLVARSDKERLRQHSLLTGDCPEAHRSRNPKGKR